MTKHQYVFGRSQKLKVMYCPFCHDLIDGVTPVNHKNAPGKNEHKEALSICTHCGHVLIWNKAADKWVKPDPEFAEKMLNESPAIKQLHKSVVETILAKAIKI